MRVNGFPLINGIIKGKGPHSIVFRGGVCHHSSKAARGQDLEIEELVSCWNFASFGFHATLAGMLRATLIRHQVV
jgi:hypothetical protein